MVRQSYLHRADFATHHLPCRQADKIFNALFTTKPKAFCALAQCAGLAYEAAD
jgi:hypothetical protein